MRCPSCPYDGDGTTFTVGTCRRDAIEFTTCPICEDLMNKDTDPDGPIDIDPMNHPPAPQ